MAAKHDEDISGRIAGVNLSSFLQMIEMEQKTCTVRIFTRKDTGRIYFSGGRLIDADTRNLKQLEALNAILSWKNIVIEVEKNLSRKEDVINLPLMHILMESARISDEGEEKAEPDGDEGGLPAAARDIPLQVVKSREFCLEIGIRLLMDVDGLGLTFRSALVGIEHGKYLLIKTPGAFDKEADQDFFSARGVVIKTLYKGTIYAFRSRVLGVISEPSPLMFIEYPGRIEHHELRRHKRFKCSIVARAGRNGAERDGVIKNISKGGCRCVMENFCEAHQSVNDLLNETLVFQCRFPGSDQETGFEAQIRNAVMRSGEVAVGLKFLDLERNETVQKDIHDYIRLIEWSSEAV